jgi:hypothetical protein
MIGIIKPDPNYSTSEQVAADRGLWPHLLETSDEGDPVFNFDKCAEWTGAQSGEPLDRCRKVLFAEWGDEEDQKNA